MMKKIFCLVALLSATTISYGQIAKAQIALDEKRIADAQAAIAKAIAPEAIQEDLAKGKAMKAAEAYNLAGNIESHVLNPEILKAAKGQPLDTTLFVTTLDKAINYFTLSHKYEVQSGKKPKYFANNHKMIRQMLQYPAYAGQFLYARKDYQGAYKHFKQFLDMPDNPVFSKGERDTLLIDGAKTFSEIAFYNSVLAFQQFKDPDKVLANIDRALQNPDHAEDCYLMKATALLQKKDTAAWVNCSKEAIKALPNSTTFTQNLLYYYMTKNDKAEAVSTANDLVNQAPDNKMAWYANGCIKLNVEKDYEGARTSFKKALAIDPNFAEAQYNMGISYINEVVSMKDQLTDLNSNNRQKYEAARQKVLGYYRNALPYFEKTRELEPDNAKLWAQALKNVYYNLQMKDKEKEMDELLKGL